MQRPAHENPQGVPCSAFCRPAARRLRQPAELRRERCCAHQPPITPDSGEVNTGANVGNGDGAIVGDVVGVFVGGDVGHGEGLNVGNNEGDIVGISVG